MDGEDVKKIYDERSLSIMQTAEDAFELGANRVQGFMCNPAGQAGYLKENHTELNISMGLCVGHDMIFNQKSEAPVTVLIVKDQAHRGNPMESFNEVKREAAKG